MTERRTNKWFVMVLSVLIVIALGGILSNWGVFTGRPTDSGSVQVTVNADVDIECIDCGVAFGNLTLGTVHHTLNRTDANRMKINNSGTTVVDVDIYAFKPLFNRTCRSGSNPANYSANNCFQAYCNSSKVQESAGQAIGSSNPACNFNYINKWRNVPIRNGAGTVTNQESVAENLTYKANFSGKRYLRLIRSKLSSGDNFLNSSSAAR